MFLWFPPRGPCIACRSWWHVNMDAKIKKKHEFPKLAVDKVEKFVFLRIKPATRFAAVSP